MGPGNGKSYGQRQSLQQFPTSSAQLVWLVSLFADPQPHKVYIRDEQLGKNSKNVAVYCRNSLWLSLRHINEPSIE
ncbi:hypothetical protein GBA52_025457 [Prunus armeniaca]|nr:hypothetical protein GBA52_025457 [Prunus armeniaca]